ncbi:hypothetical protein [Poritiphilus flavus]|uniref:Uncharacterized protein n=1 Tax=Poritiphilus flavus TaxID=2697053 RepID=A0A6L9E786_9FLAO|nr:hypothetical protein [Poritiphilus flavus]NAS10433.1 hypothetical protein [Poritiphilus flavus]
MKRYTYIWVLSFCLGCVGGPENLSEPFVPEVRLLTEQTEFVAGSEIILQFETTAKSPPLLLLENALGSTLIAPESQDSSIQFTLPGPYAQKAGLSRWKLIYSQQEVLSGQLNIGSAQEEQPLLEAYLGPPSLMAGDEDFAMLAVIPTDRFDNPLKGKWPITLRQYKEDSEQSSQFFTQDLLAWKLINSTRQSGPLFVSANTEQSQSKELQTFVYPANPLDFEISLELIHNYADGNQIMQLSTSVLKDAYGNTVSDGTLVEFHISTDSGSKLGCTGTTIKGVAQSKMLHPEQASEWEISAYVAGAAKSNSLTVNFEAVFDDFGLKTSKNGRVLRVGPIKSYLGQIIPDGFQVVLNVSNEDNVTETFTTTTRNGYARFELDPDAYPPDQYQLELISGGVIKNISHTVDE